MYVTEYNKTPFFIKDSGDNSFYISQ